MWRTIEMTVESKISILKRQNTTVPQIGLSRLILQPQSSILYFDPSECQRCEAREIWTSHLYWRESEWETMDDSGAILCQISQLKDMLDKVPLYINICMHECIYNVREFGWICRFQVNEEIEANIQITREIESEIVKCTETEVALLARQSELMKTAYTLQFEISGLMAATGKTIEFWFIWKQCTLSWKFHFFFPFQFVIRT